MGLFNVPSLLKTLLLLSTIGVITPFIEASSDGNVARKLYFTTRVMEDNNITSSSYPSPSPPPSQPPSPAEERSNVSSFKPNIAVVVAVLTTVFSITFLLLLYAKHCKGGRNGYYSASSRARAPPSMARKNSGVDRTVIESLPIFRFGSLRGEKDGLECAVCLNRFESTEVLRLLPKCKHAFHVECVDTWLDAHSTCPLCRYRVDPEDILLLADFAKILAPNEPLPPPPPPQTTALGGEKNERLESIRRVSGRHSSAGERGSSSSSSGGSLQIVLHRPSDSSRRSLDSWNMRKTKKQPEIVSVGCFDRQCRKDGLLLTSQEDRRRLEHRIIIGGGGGGGGFYRRWSDVQASDLLYLRSEMVMSDSRRLSASSSGSRPSESRHQQQNHPQQQQQQQHNEWQSGRSVINGRSVSEITRLSRFGNTNYNGHRQRRQNHQEWRWRWRRREAEGEAGVVSRWMGWISQSQSETQLTQPDVQS